MHAVFVDTTMTTPPTGGAQTFLIELTSELISDGWQVTIVTQPGPETGIIASLREVGGAVQADLWRDSHLPEERGRALAAWVNAERPAVYVVSISPDSGWLALPLLDRGIPTVSIAHNDVSAFYAPVAHYAPLIDCAVGVSEEISRRLREDCGVPAARVKHIPYGIHSVSRDEVDRRVSAHQHINDPLRIAYVGRVVEPQKRVSELVQVAVGLNARGVSFELHIVGDGDARRHLETEFTSHGLARFVTFHGWLSPAEVELVLRGMHVFVLMSDHEGLPVALLEAMGHGLAPVVTSIASGNTQLVHEGENGMLFSVADSAACAEKIGMLADHADLLRSIRLAAWQTATEYSVKRMTERYRECFATVADPKFPRTDRSALPLPYPLLPACRSRYPFWMRKVKHRLLAATRNRNGRGLAKNPL